MKGTIILVPIRNPYEGMTVIWNNEIYTLNGKEDKNHPGYQDSYWLVGNKYENTSYEPLHVFQQMKIEYVDILPSDTRRGNTRMIEVKRQLPIHSCQWNTLLPFIGQQLPFEFDTEVIEQHEGPAILSPCAKILLPTPVRTINDIPEDLRHKYKNFPFEVTGVDVAEALFEIHQHHPKTGKIIYFEDDLLKVLKKFGLPEPQWDKIK